MSKSDVKFPFAADHIVRDEPLIFERSRAGRRGYLLPDLDVPARRAEELLPASLVRDDIPGMPEVSEVEVVRHFTRLSTWNAAVDLGPYPLGSCTMKYNPKLNERVARLAGFAGAHPMQPDELAQGVLALCHRLEAWLAEVSGMDRVSLQPAAGAQGELAGIMMIRAYHAQRGRPRHKVLVPESAHGTNPASAALNGYQVVAVPAGDDGILHPEAVAAVMDDDVAALMVTNPNTLGIFERHIADEDDPGRAARGVEWQRSGEEGEIETRHIFERGLERPLRPNRRRDERGQRAKEGKGGNDLIAAGIPLSLTAQQAEPFELVALMLKTADRLFEQAREIGERGAHLGTREHLAQDQRPHPGRKELLQQGIRRRRSVHPHHSRIS